MYALVSTIKYCPGLQLLIHGLTSTAEVSLNGFGKVDYKQGKYRT